MKTLLRVAVVLVALASAAAFAAPRNEVRATFERFVAAQNAHDLKTLEPLLLDSPQFLWITRGNAVWGRAEAVKRFESLYAGTWHLEPDYAEFRVVFAQSHVAQIYVPIAFSIGAAGQPPQETRFLMNQTLVKSGGSWRIASILPIPVPPPVAAK